MRRCLIYLYRSPCLFLPSVVRSKCISTLFEACAELFLGILGQDVLVIVVVAVVVVETHAFPACSIILGSSRRRAKTWLLLHALDPCRRGNISFEHGEVRTLFNCVDGSLGIWRVRLWLYVTIRQICRSMADIICSETDNASQSPSHLSLPHQRREEGDYM